MNILQVQDRLKGFSEQQLAQEMQMPSGMAPQFLVLSELQRRKRVRDEFQAQQNAPQSTVAQDAIAAAGMPQAPLQQMAQALAPKTDVAQNTGIMSIAPQASAQPEEAPVQRMYGGGQVKKMQEGRAVYTDPVIIAMASRMGMSIDDYLKSEGPRAARIIAESENRARRDRMVGMEPVGDGITFPTQADLDRRFAESQARPDVFPNSGFSEPGPELLGFGSYDGGPSPQRPGAANASMTSVPRAIAAGTDLGGRSGMVDALLASRIPVANSADYMPPDPFAVRMALAAQEDPYYPGPAAATELNLPAFRSPSAGGAGLASGLLAAAEGYRPPVEPGAGRAGPMTGGNRAAEVFMPGPAAATELNLPAFRNLTAPSRGAGLATGLRDAAEAGPLPLDPRIVDAEGVLRGQLIEMGIPTGEVDMEAEARRSAEEVAAARDAAGITRSREAPFGSEEDATPPGGGATTPSGGAGAGAAPMSSYEQELASALGRVEKRANQDKWLALAQAGMALMSSKEPTLMGALGEAGIAGLGQYQQTRDAAEKERMGILSAQYQMDMDRQKMALARAGSGGGGGGGGGYSSGAERLLDRYDAEVAALDGQLDALGYGPGVDLRAIAEANPEAALAIQELINKREQLMAVAGMVKAQVVPGYAAIVGGGGSGGVDLSDE